MIKIIRANCDSEENLHQYVKLLGQLTQVGNLDFDELKIFINQSNHIYWLLYNNEVIGTASMFIEQKAIHNFGKVAHIEDVVIREEYRGKHYGLFIINNLIDIAKNEKCYKIILDCDKEHEKFYEKCGFLNKGNFMAIYTNTENSCKL